MSNPLCDDDLGIANVPSAKPKNSLSKTMRLRPLPSLVVTLTKLPGLGTVEMYATTLLRCRQAQSLSQKGNRPGLSDVETG